MSQKSQVRRRHARRGQTLIEVGIILAVIGLLATAVLISVIPKLDAARRDRAALDLENLEGALQLYHRTQGRYPEPTRGFHALVEAGALEAVAQDPWKNDYVYRLEADGPVILSYGEDGEAGGEGVDADLVRKASPPPLSPSP